MPPSAIRLLLRGRRALPHVLRGGLVFGSCPICQTRTLFVEEGTWLRDQCLCVRCKSIPRWQALIAVLEEHFPAWRALTIHESTPGGPASEKLARDCQGYVATHFLPDTPPGAAKDGVRCKDLEALTSADGSFDLVVTQDVYERQFGPARLLADQDLQSAGARAVSRRSSVTPGSGRSICSRPPTGRSSGPPRAEQSDASATTRNAPMPVL